MLTVSCVFLSEYAVSRTLGAGSLPGLSCLSREMLRFFPPRFFWGCLSVYRVLIVACDPMHARLAHRHRQALHLTASVSSGIAAALLCAPFDLVKSRVRMTLTSFCPLFFAIFRLNHHGWRLALNETLRSDNFPGG